MKRRLTIYDEAPKQPVPDKDKFKIETLTSVAERFNHWPNSENEDYNEDEEDMPEFTGSLPNRQAISLQTIINVVNERGIDPNNVYLTASFSDDYLCLEAVYIKKLNEQEQQEEYNAEYAEWEKIQSAAKKEELRRIEYDIKTLKDRKNRLQ